jgi:hypothetical protein
MESTGNGVKCNRKEAVKLVGEKNVSAVEGENCEWSSGGGKSNGDYDTVQTWKARHVCKGAGTDGVDVVITAVYHVDDDEFIDSGGDPIEDLSNIDWEIDHYLIG